MKVCFKVIQMKKMKKGKNVFLLFVFVAFLILSVCIDEGLYWFLLFGVYLYH